MPRNHRNQVQAYKVGRPKNDLIDPEVVAFFEKFYRISDDPDGIEDYIHSFAIRGRFILGDDLAHGRHAIRQLRESMWASVASRKHFALKIFSFGPDSTKYMLHGKVHKVLDDGNETRNEWAARTHMTKYKGHWQMKSYQVYMGNSYQPASKQGEIEKDQDESQEEPIESEEEQAEVEKEQTEVEEEHGEPKEEQAKLKEEPVGSEEQGEPKEEQGDPKEVQGDLKEEPIRSKEQAEPKDEQREFKEEQADSKKEE